MKTQIQTTKPILPQLLTLFLTVATLSLVGSLQAQAALTPDLSMYLRTSSGANGVGGAQECYNNPGAWGNEFRLGNECVTYGEFGFGAWVLKAQKEGDPFFRFFANFALVYNNQTDWEAPEIKTTGTSMSDLNVSLRNGNVWVMREVYAEGGNFEGMPFTVWAGKRFYRWGDVHMMDYYPIAMSGPGGGIGGIKTDVGTWSLAVIQNAKSSEINGSGDIKTDVGTAAKTSVHLRADGIDLPIGWGAIWATAAATPPAKNKTSGQDYRKSTGGLFAFRLNSALAQGVNNELGVAYGGGNMSNFGPAGELYKDCSTDTDAACTVESSQRLRAWDSIVYEGGRFSGQLAVLFDDYDRGTSTKSKFQWLSIGIRPVYWFNDHISLTGQAGVSTVNDESDSLGARTLTRFTLAPQVSLGKSYWSRPVVRAYVSHTSWSDNNKGLASGTTAEGKTEALSVGMQTEVWF